MRESLNNDTDKPRGKVASFVATVLHRLGELQPNATFDRKASVDKANARETEPAPPDVVADPVTDTAGGLQTDDATQPRLRLLQGGRTDDARPQSWQPPRRPPSGTAA